MQTYTVHMAFKYPAWDERDGIDYRDIQARTKAEAISYARRRASNDGHVGVRYFSAKEEQDGEE